MSGVLVDGQEAADHTQMCWQHQYDVLPQVGWAERMVVVVTHTQLTTKDLSFHPWPSMHFSVDTKLCQLSYSALTSR